jgi:hypothetical protein
MSQERTEPMIHSAETFVSTTTTNETTFVEQTTRSQRQVVRSATRTTRHQQNRVAVDAAPTQAATERREIKDEQPMAPAAASPGALPAPPASPVSAAPTAATKALQKVEAIVEPVIAVLPARVQPFAHHVVDVAKPYVEQAVDNVLPYADLVVAKAEPVLTTTKDHIQAASNKTKDSVFATAQPLVNLVQPYVDATVEHAAKARGMASDVIDQTKQRMQESSEAFTAAKKRADATKASYVEYSTGTARSYFEKITSFVQSCAAVSQERLAFIRAKPREVVVAGTEYAAAKKEVLVALVQERAQSAASAASQRFQPVVTTMQPYFERAQPLAQSTIARARAAAGTACSSLDATAAATRSAASSAHSFAEAQRVRFHEAKKSVMEALIPAESSEGERGKDVPASSTSRVVRVACLSFRMVTNSVLFVLAKIAETEPAKGVAEAWQVKKKNISEDTNVTRVAAWATAWFKAGRTAAGGVAGKTTAVFALVGKPFRAGSA